MSQKVLVVFGGIMLMSVLSVSAFAQRWQNGGAVGQGRFGAGARACEAQLDLANKVTLDGTVTSVNMGPGQGFPSFVVTQADGKTATVVASPFRALVDANFKISIGDSVSVGAYPSLRYKDAFVASEISNKSNGKPIVLRGADGVPTGTPGGRRGNCPFAPLR